MKKLHLAILLNFLYWIPRVYSLSVFFLAPINIINAPQLKINFLLSLESFILSVIVFYLFYFFFAPMLLSKQKEKIAYALWFGTFLLLIITCIGYLVQQIIVFNYWGMSWFWLINYLLLDIYAAFAACLIKAFLNWYSDIFYKRQLEKKNLETELALLKAQINPHFLFNTLNNIDVLIEKDAKAASVYLKKLSGILRFMLYESPLKKIALTQEVEYIHEYIELQKIRTSNPNFVHFNINGDIDKMQIAPMLFIPFIENAFKHCTNKKINNAVEIAITVRGNEIDFVCSNAFDQSVLPTQEHSGLGLELIRNRLNLLYKNHQLNIDKTNSRFSVALTLKPDDN